MKKDVSIIIVNYCSTDMAIEAVQSIVRETSGVSYEIIIVDNASMDGSLKKFGVLAGTNTRLISSDENLGFGKANNLGASYAEGEYLLLLNPDTLLLNNAVYTLWDYIKNHPEVGTVGGNLYTPERQPIPSYCLTFDSVHAEKRKATWRSILSGKVKDKVSGFIPLVKNKSFRKSFNYSKKAKKVAYVFGTDMMISKNLFDELGGFDPDFFMYAEEEEMSWRIVEKGYSNVSVPEAKIAHLEGATSKESGSFSKKTFSLRMNGAMTYYLKRYGARGVKAFYHYRSKYYQRLIKLAKIRRKELSIVAPVQMNELLRKEYRDFLYKHGLVKRG